MRRNSRKFAPSVSTLEGRIALSGGVDDPSGGAVEMGDHPTLPPYDPTLPPGPNNPSPPSPGDPGGPSDPC